MSASQAEYAGSIPVARSECDGFMIIVFLCSDHEQMQKLTVKQNERVHFGELPVQCCDLFLKYTNLLI